MGQFPLLCDCGELEGCSGPHNQGDNKPVPLRRCLSNRSAQSGKGCSNKTPRIVQGEHGKNKGIYDEPGDELSLHEGSGVQG